MQKQEADLYLSFDGPEDLDDRYEEELFNFQQFFTSRFPVTKLFESKLNKLSKLDEAYIFHGGNIRTQEQSFEFELDTSSVQAAFNSYQFLRNQLRQSISIAKSGREVRAIVLNLIKLTDAYADLWQVDVESGLSLSISKEPDPMELVEAFREHPNLDFSELNELSDENPLKTEAKRLSLWRKFEQNG